MTLILLIGLLSLIVVAYAAESSSGPDSSAGAGETSPSTPADAGPTSPDEDEGSGPSVTTDDIKAEFAKRAKAEGDSKSPQPPT